MTKIGDIPSGELRERHRREILGIVEARRRETNEALSELSKISSVIYSGGTIAILSFIASRKEGAVPSYAIISFIFFILSLLSFALFLYLHYQLHAARSAHYADSAHRFFFSELTLEELIEMQSELQSAWLYRLVFWVPFSFATLGFCFGVAAALIAYS
jgi:glucan phosphoethanolaminetransferase (alkaline phosphatase superfamily)